MTQEKSRTDEYDAVITQHPDHAEVAIRRDGATLQSWTSDVAASKRGAERRNIIIADAFAHGWSLPPEWPRPVRGAVTVTGIVATNWTTIIDELATRRTALLDQLADLETAWQETLADAHRIGQMPVAAVSKTSGLSVPRIYKVLQAKPAEGPTSTQAMQAAVRERARQRQAKTSTPTTGD